MISELALSTRRRAEFVHITPEVQRVVRDSGVTSGTCIVYVPHTTAGVTINENADPAVVRDILMEVNKIIPLEDHYRHLEGNSAAHIKSSLVGCDQTIPVEDGQLALGTWQSVFFCEFDGPRQRQVIIQVIGQMS